MNFFTVFTPTYNRDKLLVRVYESLKRQTYKDFCWLIIDDGSTDNTYSLIKGWQKENLLNIEYHRIEQNMGKHIALKMAFDLIRTKYMLDIDDDDELTEDCLQVFHDEWMKLEKEGNTEIGSIRALVMDDYGKILGNYEPHKDCGILDINYNEMVFKKHKRFENITSNRTEIVRQANLFRDEHKWLYDRIKNINPGIFWMRLGCVTTTRYLFQPLRIYHYDAPYSLTRVKKNYAQMWINRFFTTKLELNEFGHYLLYSPKYFVRNFIECSVYSVATNLPFSKVYKSFDTHFFAAIFLLSYPIAIVGAFILKIKYKNKGL